MATNLIQSIYDYVLAHPGKAADEITSELGLTKTQVWGTLDVLKRRGNVSSELPTGSRTNVWYPTDKPHTPGKRQARKNKNTPDPAQGAAARTRRFRRAMDELLSAFDDIEKNIVSDKDLQRLEKLGDVAKLLK